MTDFFLSTRRVRNDPGDGVSSPEPIAMMLTEVAAEYLQSRKITRKEPLYSANRFAYLVGNLDPRQIKTEHLNKYRQAATAKNLAPKTIESSVEDIVTLVRFATGSRVEFGDRMRIPEPDPGRELVPISDIEATWPNAAAWLQQWIAIAYWTGLRLTDTMLLLVELQQEVPDVIRIRAGKTGKTHAIPVPSWLRRIVQPVEIPFTRPTDFARRRLRLAIEAACIAARTDVWVPKNLRKTSLTEWTSASPAAGELIHGCGFSQAHNRVMRHYVDKLRVIESAAPRVRLPACFGACSQEASEATLLDHYRRLDPSAQGLMFGMAERLAAG